MAGNIISIERPNNDPSTPGVNSGVMGPTFFLHLPRAFPAESIEALDARLRHEMHRVTRVRSSWEFWPASAGSCLSSLAVVPFACQAAGPGEVSDSYLEDDEIQAFIDALGYRPEESLQFDNYCSSDRDGHLLLARFALSLMTEFKGVADIGGTTPPISYERLPGVLHLPDGTYLLEQEAFEKWCSHPGFYLDK